MEDLSAGYNSTVKCYKRQYRGSFAIHGWTSGETFCRAQIVFKTYFQVFQIPTEESWKKNDPREIYVVNYPSNCWTRTCVVQTTRHFCKIYKPLAGSIRSTGYNIYVIGNTEQPNLIKTRNPQKVRNITIATRIPSIGQFREKGPNCFFLVPFDSRKINFLNRVAISEHRHNIIVLITIWQNTSLRSVTCEMLFILFHHTLIFIKFILLTH